MKKLFFTLIVFFLAIPFAKAQDAGAEMRHENKMIGEISLRKMTEMQKIEILPAQKIELPKVAILSLEGGTKNEFAQKIQLFAPNKQLSKTQMRLQQKVEKVASSKTGQWLIKKLAKMQLKKELRKELRKVKGNKVAEQILREKYAKKQMALSGNLKIAVILGIIGVILTLLPSETLQLLGIICIIVALVFLLLHFINN